jgi:hypothetical protein
MNNIDLHDFAHALKKATIDARVLKVVMEELSTREIWHTRRANLMESCPDPDSSSIAQHRACAQQMRTLLAVIDTNRRALDR